MEDTENYIPKQNEPNFLKYFSERDAKLLQGMIRLRELQEYNLIQISDEGVEMVISPFQTPPDED